MSKNNYFNTIKAAMEEHDIYQYKIINFLKKIEYLKINNINLNITPRIKFYDINKNLLFESGYEILGKYNQKNSTWYWGWSILSINNNQNFISRNILNYSFKLNFDTQQEVLLKSILLQSRHLIKNKMQLEILLAISSYLSKFQFIFKVPFLPEIFNEYINYKSLFTDNNFNNSDIYYLFIIDYNFNHDNQY